MYRSPSLAQCLLSMMVLCVVMFMANVGLEQDITLFFKMLCFLCAAGFQIVIYCYNGQKIITQVSESIKKKLLTKIKLFYRARSHLRFGIAALGTMSLNNLNTL